ncbi:hypothetical protein [Methylorubrum extorquens]|uniref:Uncharacterized protein n=1 Tax=Methylorubrum extorquens (strain ATCC 14718 / DSM 1338 / JCM 2805 / NCIMB 9133 / AM1) TaxID=272630 RepID=C5APF0_METEA|nr:hypothetical protein [Methylorubrum extorquens]ACS38035.1 hypothetical protein MexAM1_META1p0067 [Methylorubrum extorquens AM1]MCP1543922.1 hypothetical protein [Methylorubrum extorquens]MCP1588732.1 hypothetical protein [Methylorubrum extorquens]
MTAKPANRTKLPALVHETPLPPQPPALMLFGRNRSGKPCAAWFNRSQAEAATAVAVTMKLRVLPVTGDDSRALALQLAQGRILPSGKAHVPGARRDLYGRLAVLAGESAGLSITERLEERTEPSREPDAPACEAPTAKADETEPPHEPFAAEPSVPNAVRVLSAVAAADAPPKPRPGDGLFVGEVRPTTREQIGLGSIVLAQEGPDEGWWEAEVIGCNGRVFSLRWRNYDPVTFPSVLRPLGELALLPPGEA